MQFEFPGLCDLQVNGFAGVDFNDPSARPEEIATAIQKMYGTGVTRFLPTLITSSLERFRACAANLLATQDAAIAGIHMEGPYICNLDGPRGAHSEAEIVMPSYDGFARRQAAAAGKILLVTLAPELPGALTLIERLVAEGVRVAIGHSAASPQQIQEAIRAGATLATHLGNGCAFQLSRHPNLIWEQLAADELFASLIVDGHHLPPATVKAMVRAKSPVRTLLVTDAIAAAGGGPGRYKLNGEWVELDATGRVSPPGKPWLAGSALTLEVAVANAVRYAKVSVSEAWAMASTLPATYLGLKPRGRVRADWDEAQGRFTQLEVLES